MSFWFRGNRSCEEWAIASERSFFVPFHYQASVFWNIKIDFQNTRKDYVEATAKGENIASEYKCCSLIFSLWCIQNILCILLVNKKKWTPPLLSYLLKRQKTVNPYLTKGSTFSSFKLLPKTLFGEIHQFDWQWMYRLQRPDKIKATSNKMWINQPERQTSPFIPYLWFLVRKYSISFFPHSRMLHSHQRTCSRCITSVWLQDHLGFLMVLAPTTPVKANLQIVAWSLKTTSWSDGNCCIYLLKIPRRR